jgi:hypothetical protein
MDVGEYLFVYQMLYIDQCGGGRFIYMDLLQLIGDVRAGLVALTLEQVVYSRYQIFLDDENSCYVWNVLVSL